MTELKVKDLGGDTIRCVDVGDNYITPIVLKTATEIKAVFDKVPDIPLRDDDVMLCSFAKTVEYLKYSEYLKEWEQAIAEGVGFPLHVMFFEDLKLNFKYEIGRLTEFLDVTLDEETMSNIADTCHFKKMSKDKKFEEGVKESFVPGFNFFRKGEIGDWKNWFTVDQNEKFNKYWEEEMKGSKFIFKYTGKEE